MSFKRNLGNLKTKETFFKACCLGLLTLAWVFAGLIISNQRTAEAAATTQDSIVAESENSEIVSDDGGDTPNETQSTSLSDYVLAGGSFEGDLGSLADAGEAINTFFGNVAEELGLVETEGDFSGAPSDVPKDALSRPETEALIETEANPETEIPVETEPAEKQISDYPYDEGQAVALAQLMWAEARGCSKREQSLVAWTVLNRVDVGYDGMGDFWSILTAPSQFAYYSSNPYEEYEYRIAVDVLQRWAAEKDGVEESGRTLPKGYLYYHGDGQHNWFSPDGSTDELWFGLGDPYENW